LQELSQQQKLCIPEESAPRMEWCDRQIINKVNSIKGYMKTLIQVRKEGKFYVAVDIISHVADQGKTREEAISNLKKGLEEHYQILLELASKEGKISFLEIEVEKYAQAPHPLSERGN
jgi:predicted RNase H-like HicB family nuclease